MNSQRKVVVAITFLLSVIVLFFYQTIVFGRLPIPSDTLVGLYHPWRDFYTDSYPRGIPFKNFLITDPVRQQIPWRKISMDQWKQGILPRWNPYSFAGAPLDANIQAAAYYPFNILFLLFPFAMAWSLLIILQPVGASVFLFLYLRYQKVSIISSVLGGVIWAFSGFGIAWLTWGTMMQAAMWIPLILYSIDHLLTFEILKKKNISWIALFFVSAVMMLSAGHSQIALYGLGLAVLYGFWKSKCVFGVKYFTIVLILGLVAVAIWLPQFRYVVQTVRVSQERNVIPEGWFLPWQNFIQFIAPDFFGNPATLNYWGVWNYGEFIGYIGMIPLIFAISAFFTSALTAFWSIVILTSLFFMLPHPLTQFFYSLHIPMLGVLQPTRLMVLVDLGLCVLAAFGLDIFRARRFQKVFQSVLGVGILLGISWAIVLTMQKAGVDATTVQNMYVARRNLLFPTGIYAIAVILLLAAQKFKLRKRYIITLIVVIVATMDIFRFGWKFTPFTQSAYFFPTTRVIEFLQKQPRPFRIASLDDRILPPNVSGYYGIETIEGYDPLALQRYEDLLVASERGKADLSRPSGFNRIYTVHNTQSKLFPLFNVKYVLSLQPISAPGFTQVFQEGETRVYKNSYTLPRAYFAQSITKKLHSTPTKLLETLIDIQPISRSVMVETDIPVLSVPLQSDELVQIEEYSDAKITATTISVNSRLLVLLNSYTSQMKAAIDNIVTPTMRVNYLFTGVVVPAGAHKVVFTY